MAEKNVFVEIQTNRLLLRKMEIADAPVLYKYWSDEEVTKYMNILSFESIKQAEDMIAFLNSLSVEGKAFRWSIICKSNKQILGTCGFNNWDKENQRAEIGYELGKEHWGQGFMTEALSALISHGFEMMELNRIQALAEPANVLSRKILMKLGFKEEGLLRQYEKARGNFIDINMYSIVKNDIQG